MGFAWPIVYMRARRLYDSPRRPNQLKYFHGDSRPLCAPHAPPSPLPFWIGTPEVTSTRGEFPDFPTGICVACVDGWIFFQVDGNLRRGFFSFRFSSSKERGKRIVLSRRIGRNEWMRLVEGGYGREIFVIVYYRICKCSTMGFWNCSKFLFVCNGTECRSRLKGCYSL